MSKQQLYIGLMSGTSLDGLDAALVSFEQGITPQLVASHHIPFDDELAFEIQALNSPVDNELARAQVLGKQISQLSAQAVNALLAETGLAASEVIAIGSHGQTLRHEPKQTPAYTLQVGCPALLAELTGITVCHDFRSRDIAAGGQGAPLVPAFHEEYLSSTTNRGVVNIGGMANLTVLEQGEPVRGFDTGPGNVLLDAWIYQAKHKRYDKNGRWAEQAEPDSALLAQMLAFPYFAESFPKSTGREVFDLHFIEQFDAVKQLAPNVVQSTLMALTVESIAQAANEFDIAELVVCGGGANNNAMMHRLSARVAPIKVIKSAELGLEQDWLEAIAFAWLAKRLIDGVPANAPTVTGAAKAKVLGSITPA